MAPRRNVKAVCVTTNNNNNYSNLSFNDVLCPICRSILIEPVTLPCNHGFCSMCFDGTIANTNLVCPLCRIRIGSWLRRTSKKDSLVNRTLWEAIKNSFPTQIKNKLEGKEEYVQEEAPKLLTVPGEIRREYEIQKAKEDLEIQKQHEAENKASEALIKKLAEEQEYEECLRNENILLSEQVAKKLAEECSSVPGPSSSKSNNVSIGVKKQIPIDGLFKRMSEKVASLPHKVENSLVKEYTCKILCQDKNKDRQHVNNSKASFSLKSQEKFKRIVSEGDTCDSSDSITSECRYFKPIDLRHIPLPVKVPVIKVPAIIARINTVIIGPPKSESHFIHSVTESAFAVVKISVTSNITSKRHSFANEVNPSTSAACSFSSSHTVVHNSLETSMDQKTDMESPVLSQTKSNYKISKRKRLRATPVDETVPVKQVKIVNDVKSPPFLGFDNKTIKIKNNGAIAVMDTESDVPLRLKDSYKTTRKIQEEEDFKFAQKLQEELNRSDYSIRNRISGKTNKVKNSARQVTLKEIISQTVSKVP